MSTAGMGTTVITQNDYFIAIKDQFKTSNLELIMIL